MFRRYFMAGFNLRRKRERERERERATNIAEKLDNLDKPAALGNPGQVGLTKGFWTGRTRMPRTSPSWHSIGSHPLKQPSTKKRCWHPASQSY